MQDLMFEAALAGVIVTMLLALIRAILGPTVFDRILALNMFGTDCAVNRRGGLWAGRPDF